MERVRFEDIVTRVNTKEDRFSTDKIYYVGGEHIESNDIKVHQRGIIKGSTIGPMFYCGFKAGDVLFVTRNPHLRKCAIVDFDGICSEKTFVLGTKDPTRLLQEYLPLIMQSNDFWAYCEENKSGGVNFFVNWSTLANYEFELPSLEEQRVLADKLWAAYEVKESYKNLLAQTDKLLHAQFEKMFGDPNNSYNEQELFDYDDVCFDDTKSATKIPENTFLKEGKYPIYSQGKDSEIAYTNIEDGLCNKIPVVLFGDHTREFKLIKEPFYIGADGVKLIRPKEGIQYDVEFLYYLLRYRDIPNTGYNRHYKWVKLFRLPVPPMKKQLEFVSIAEQAEQTKASLNKGIEAIEAVIRSLIAEGTTKV